MLLLDIIIIDLAYYELTMIFSEEISICYYTAAKGKKFLFVNC
jgi:hypothetical protein